MHGPCILRCPRETLVMWLGILLGSFKKRPLFDWTHVDLVRFEVLAIPPHTLWTAARLQVCTRLTLFDVCPMSGTISPSAPRPGDDRHRLPTSPRPRRVIAS